MPPGRPPRVSLTEASLSGGSTAAEPHLLPGVTVTKVKATRKAAGKGDLGFESLLWSAADQLRGSMGASEYKHPVLGLIFLKYISDAFEEKHALLAADPESDPEDRDEYLPENVFWVPPDARWLQIAEKARFPQIGEIVNAAMIARWQRKSGMIPSAASSSASRTRNSRFTTRLR